MKPNTLSRVSIEEKLNRILSLMILLTLLVATVTLSLREYADQQERLDKKLALTADVIGQNSCVALLFEDKKTAQEVLNALTHDTEIISGRIESTEGELMAIYSPGLSDWQGFWPSGLPKSRQISRPIFHNSQTLVGKITLSGDLKPTYERLIHNALINALIVWVALSIAGLLVLRLQRSFLKPILKLADTARQIGQDHDYNKRSDYEGNDEISDLSEAFNNMLLQIQRNEAYLELQVQSRTQDLLLAIQEAESANQAKSQFLANMSHEIRTPMNAIFGLVELCLNYPLEPKLRDYLERVETASSSLMAIINDILDFSKMEAGKMYLESKPFLLDSMLDDVYTTLVELARNKDLSLTFPVSRVNHYFLIGDAGRLRQILINLLGNAIKFTESGEVKLTVTELNRDSYQLYLKFQISDTGIGMGQAQQNQLFQAFNQGDSSVTRHYGGTGLGLVISKQLIELMGGSIQVFSQEHQGTTFVFSVCLQIAESTQICHLPSPRQYALDLPGLQKLSGAQILLVEDNVLNQLVAAELLKQAQMVVDIAENGEAALRMFSHKAYDAVLMDVQMPILDGYKTSELLRNSLAGKYLPIIGMTASVVQNERNQCLKAGMNDFISKPIRAETLFSVLLKWINRGVESF